MNTMAGGAAQRLVAQIGEMDLPELPPRDVVDTHLPTGVRIYGYTAEQMREYARAALASQSSPAGQGDAVTGTMIEAAIAAFFKGHAWSAIGDRQAVEAKMRETLQAALAARQPDTDEQYADEQALIDHLDALLDDSGMGSEKWPPAQAAIAGILAARDSGGGDWLDDYAAMEEAWPDSAARQPEYVQGCDELCARTEGERAAYLEGLEEGKLIAARQPVVSVEFIGGHAAELVFTGPAMPDGQHDLYAAPPAQAVDLGQLRKLAESMKEMGHSYCATELLALIDSKAVGK